MKNASKVFAIFTTAIGANPELLAVAAFVLVATLLR